MFATFRFYTGPDPKVYRAIQALGESSTPAAVFAKPVAEAPGVVWEVSGNAEQLRPIIASTLTELARTGEQRVFTVTETPVAVAIIGPTGVEAQSPEPLAVAPVAVSPSQRSLDATDVEALLEALSIATTATADMRCEYLDEVLPSVRMKWGELAARLTRPGARILTFTPKQTPAIEVSRVGDQTL